MKQNAYELGKTENRPITASRVDAESTMESCVSTTCDDLHDYKATTNVQLQQANRCALCNIYIATST